MPPTTAIALALLVLADSGTASSGASDSACCPCGLADPAVLPILLELERSSDMDWPMGRLPAAPLTCADDGSLVDVLLVYTPAALVDLGSEEAIVANATLSVALANATMARSLLDTRFRLVGVAPVNYVESGNMAIDMLRLGKPADGFMDDVHPLRDALGADLVSLRVGEGQYCGIASIGKFPPDPTKAFSVLQCDGTVPAHEWGHSLGACHAMGDDDGIGVCDVLGGAFPFSRGWRFDAPQGGGEEVQTDRTQTYRTMMAYAPGSRVLVYSTPQVQWLGVPVGDAAVADNAQTIALTSPGVSAFRPATFVDCDGDGVDDACAILDGGVADCNGNWVPDACDIAPTEGGAPSSADLDCDGQPDECASMLLPGPLDLPGLAPGDAAGSAVALLHDTLAVGVPGADHVGDDAGAVLILERTPRGWQAVATLHAPEPTPHGRFGAAVAMHDAGDGSGPLLVVGRPGEHSTPGARGPRSPVGGIEVFHRQAGRWQHVSGMDAPSSDDVGFGAVLAMDAAHVAVGAPLALVQRVPATGSVHVVAHAAGRLLGSPVRLTAPEPVEPDEFGSALAWIDGRLAVGAPLDDAPVSSAGSVFIFERLLDEAGTPTWTISELLTSPDGEAFGFFGSALAAQGPRLAVAAPEEQVPPAGDGTIHLLDRSGGSWQPTALVPSGLPAVDQSGAPCAVGQGVVAAGIPHDAEAGARSGAVLLHRALGDGWLPLTVRPDDAMESARFGAAVALRGSTLAVGAPGHAGDAPGAGAVYVLEVPLPDADGDGRAAGCGRSGDLNGDGAIDGQDLALLMAAWGPCLRCAADLNGDGVVDGADLGELLGGWTG